MPDDLNAVSDEERAERVGSLAAEWVKIAKDRGCQVAFDGYIVERLVLAERRERALREAATYRQPPECDCDYIGRSVKKRGRVRHLHWCAFKSAPDLQARMDAALAQWLA